ncbi:MAG: adenylyltransferase/cytidyltransferase family protein [Coriobacteriales bacterium]|jgi:glycerol-3-phosphate cytidylyltransferase|nr:adenylyltransferase/cytidyltransferase family protein [Coriobacteriales bacterium]
MHEDWQESTTSTLKLVERRILTYGTYDVLHYGHIRLLRRAAALGDRLFVGLSSDTFNAQKGKTAFYPYDLRYEMLEAISYVDHIFIENTWEQKRHDIERFQIDMLVMGNDWEGDPRFEELRDICSIVYLDYTYGISSTEVIARLDASRVKYFSIPEVSAQVG